MVTPYFSSIRQTLVNALGQATESIDIAVAWFTNEQLFDTVASSLDKGVKVRMVLINDDINHCGGLDFQKFIDKGGRLFFGKTGYFMHNKYCIIDGKTVYTGSYNYTYFAEHSNFENIVCISDDEPAVSEYVKNFEHILSVSDETQDVESFLKEHPYATNTHATRQVRNRDLYQKANELVDRNDRSSAEAVLKEITPAAETPDSFIIKDVLYKQWKPGYCIRQILVSDSSVEMDIEIITSYSAIILYGPGLEKTWHLRTSSGVVSASDIRNVKIDGANLIEKLEANTAYEFSEATGYVSSSHWGKTTFGSTPFKERRIKPRGTITLSCKIIFPKGDYLNEIVDVYEGNDENITDKDYWHFLLVNLLLNREIL